MFPNKRKKEMRWDGRRSKLKVTGWRTDVDVFVAEGSEPGRHERISWSRKKNGASQFTRCG
jgi:hypothetical protein